MSKRWRRKSSDATAVLSEAEADDPIAVAPYLSIGQQTWPHLLGATKVIDTMSRDQDQLSTTVTRLHRAPYCFACTRWRNVSTPTRIGLWRTTIAKRSLNPCGATTSTESSARSVTPTRVANSGHEETASCNDMNGRTRCPNFASYHRCTPA